jgi:hypothetical protein
MPSPPGGVGMEYSTACSRASPESMPPTGRSIVVYVKRQANVLHVDKHVGGDSTNVVE